VKHNTIIFNFGAGVIAIALSGVLAAIAPAASFAGEPQIELSAQISMLFGGSSKSAAIKRNGHHLELQITSRVECYSIAMTNGYSCAYAYRETPFPRSSESSDVFEVTSNTYASFVLDGIETNTVATASTKLGTLTRTTKTCITTQTNTVVSESFSPIK
jgi:hypothetical protein